MISKLQTKIVNTFLNKMTTQAIASNWNAIIENNETVIARKKEKKMDNNRQCFIVLNAFGYSQVVRC